MAIQFRCPGCSTLMQVGDGSAGRKARCPKCQNVVDIPAAAHAEPSPIPPVDTLPPVVDEAEGVSATRTERPKKKAAAAPAARSRRYADDDDDAAPRRPRKPAKKSSSLGPVVILSVLGVILLSCLGCGGLGALWFYGRAEKARDEANDAANQAALPQPNPGLGVVPPNPPPNPPQGGGFIPPPPPPPVFNPPQQPQPEPPVKATLVNGKFEVEVPANAQPLDPNNFQNTKRFQFDAKADLVYRIQVSDNPNSTARVDGPAGPLPVQRDRFNNEMRRDFAFQAAQAGAHTVTLELPRFNNNQATKLTIRQLDDDEVLPEALRIKAEAPNLPTLQRTVEEKVWCSAFAFSPDSKVFWMAHMDATLSYWDHPGMLRKGSYKLGTKDRPQGLTVLGVDRKGRLYGQLAPNTAGVRLEGPTATDVSIWEDLGPDRDNVPMPAPTKTLPIRGVVKRFVNSPDGRWLYYLDTHNRKLGRIDPDKAAIDKEIDQLSPGTKSFCVTADGKKIYCCSDSNRVDVIDAKEFKFERSVKLDRGQPTDIAASNAGLVYLVGVKIEGVPGASGNIMVVDLTHGAAESAKVIVLNQWYICRSVAVLPDQRAVLFGGDRHVISYSMPSRPGVFLPVMKDIGTGDFFTPNEIVVSPDSRTVIHDKGTILSVSR